MKLLHGDCLELMKDIPDGSVDMVLCDLPYGTTRNKWDSVLPLDELWNHYHRVVKEDGAIVLNCMQPFTTELISSNRKEFKYLWYYDKHYKTGFLNARKQPLRQIEEIAVFYKKQCYFDPPTKKREKAYTHQAGATVTPNYGFHNRTYITTSDKYYASTLISDFPNANHKDKSHPTQKPVPLLEYLIKTYTNPGEIVLDNCMGSGSTGVACVNCGRDFIGIEKDDHYFEVAKERIAAAEEAQKLLYTE